MFEFIPNWHPVFVHFTVGLLLTSVLLFVLSHFVKAARVKHHILIAGKWMLWAGALFTVVTAVPMVGGTVSVFILSLLVPPVVYGSVLILKERGWGKL